MYCEFVSTSPEWSRHGVPSAWPRARVQANRRVRAPCVPRRGQPRSANLGGLRCLRRCPLRLPRSRGRRSTRLFKTLQDAKVSRKKDQQPCSSFCTKVTVSSEAIFRLPRPWSPTGFSTGALPADALRRQGGAATLPARREIGGRAKASCSTRCRPSRPAPAERRSARERRLRPAQSSARSEATRTARPWMRARRAQESKRLCLESGGSERSAYAHPLDHPAHPRSQPPLSALSAPAHRGLHDDDAQTHAHDAGVEQEEHQVVEERPGKAGAAGVRAATDQQPAALPVQMSFSGRGLQAERRQCKIQ